MGGVLSLGGAAGAGAGAGVPPPCSQAARRAHLAAAPSAAVARLGPAGKQPASPGQRAGGGHVLPVGGPGPGRAGGGPPGSSPGAGWGAPWAVTGRGWGGRGQLPPDLLSVPGLGRSCWTDRFPGHPPGSVTALGLVLSWGLCLPCLFSVQPLQHPVRDLTSTSAPHSLLHLDPW